MLCPCVAGRGERLRGGGGVGEPDRHPTGPNADIPSEVGWALQIRLEFGFNGETGAGSHALEVFEKPDYSFNEAFSVEQARLARGPKLTYPMG